jgi:NTE family protein
MLHALYERGIVPDVIVGTSAGAINGAFIASRPQTVQTAHELAAIWRGLRRGQIFPLNFLIGLLGFVGARDHLVPGSSLRKLVAEHDHGQHLEEMPTEFHVVAVDVLTGEALLLSTGPALDAVMASAAIPAVLPPVEWQGRQLMDGGPTTRRSRMRWRWAPARSTCCPRGTRAPSSSRRQARSGWRCTR